MDQVDLAIRMTADAADAANGLDKVGASADRMATNVDQATRKADDAASRLDNMAESSDTMASRSSQAAGGIGDLAGALEQTGLISEGTAMAMEGASAAIMGVTGASDLLNLVTTSSIVVKAKDRAATIAHAVSSRAAAAATRAQAVAQRVLNVAMRANPLGIVLTLLAGLVALVVLAYKRSETFRRIIDRAWAVAKAGAQATIRILGQVVAWIGGRVVGTWRAMQAAAARVWAAVRGAAQAAVARVVGFVVAARERIAGAWSAIREAAGRAWDWVRDKVAAVVGRIRDLVGGISDKVSSVGTSIRNALGGAWDYVMGKLDSVMDKVQWLLDKIPNINLPGGRGRVAAAGSGALGVLAGPFTRSAGFSSDPIPVTVDLRDTRQPAPAGDVYYIDVHADALTDLDALARRLERVLDKRARRVRGVV